MIGLRDVCESDKPTLWRWRNKPEVRAYMYTDHEISEEEHDAWFARALADPTRRYWIITCDGRDVGLVNLYEINPRQQTCSWAFYLGEEGLRGRGVGSHVEFAVLSHVFDRMNFRKLWCEVLATNDPVIRMHTKFGFQHEGTFRAHVLKQGTPADVVRLGILREEWLVVREHLKAAFVPREKAPGA
jgi:UDP-4-amino-4,6-dideoxy-N-acetyl-beta-L-altrosamine N-acetyltransferase